MTISKRIFTLFLLSFFTISLISCDNDDPFDVDYSEVPEPFDISNAEQVETETSLVYYLVEEGTGEFQVQRRDRVRVFYTGRINNTGEIFDSSYRNKNTSPTDFASLENLIAGFREGLIGMKEGEKRVLVIPPELGYGNTPNSRLSDDTLRFDVELDEIISD